MYLAKETTVATRDELIQGINQVVARSEGLVDALTDEQWSKPAYEQGWNARQILAHIAAMGSVSPVFVGWAVNPPPAPSGEGSGGGGAPDPDAWNAQQVGIRNEKSLSELLAEIRSGHQTGIKALDAVSDEQLAQTRTLLGHTGPAIDLLHGFLVGHSLEHLQDLENAARQD